MSLTKKIKKDFRSLYGLIFILLAGLRLFFNALIPLTDKTEARYGEVARLMAETGNWIVPQIDYGIPFWAKPPLSSWLSAGSISLFGDSEFGLRLPYWIVAVLIAFLMIPYGHQKKINGLIPGIILFTLPEFFLHAGVLSTDMMLSFSVAITMIGFWEFLHSEKNIIPGLLFFGGIGLGLLAKGPIIGVLSFPPLLIWCILHRISFKRIFKMPWLWGVILALLIALPWYLLMEKKSPGFINYFLFGEHFLRFIDSSWSGDKYGFPKQQPLGIIWTFLFVGTLPWFFILFGQLKQGFRKIWNNPWQLFLWLWILWTPFFFTFSKSLIHTYTLPVMIPIALLITHNWPTYKRKKTTLLVALALPILLFCAYFLKPTQNILSDSTDKNLVLHPEVDPSKLYAFPFKSYSSQFYSKGKINVIPLDKLEKMVEDSVNFSIIIKNIGLKDLSPKVVKKLHPLIERGKDGLYKLK
ncbi:MAG: glycosyltransferase family 39 protein [Bacteroidota bacterium]|nr:glycosyltransferase family 39 protein [Bacteroidota bacterium]